jgi:hypothetical protein
VGVFPAPPQCLPVAAQHGPESACQLQRLLGCAW